MESRLVIILDTHIWVWRVQGDPRLTQNYQQILKAHEPTGLGISAISCWEVAKLVQYGRLVLPCTITDWFRQALAYPGITIVELTPDVAIESCQLPGPFHSDPADQIIVATARVKGCPLITADSKILGYAHVQHLLAP